MLMNTGDKAVYSKNGLLTTVAWRLNKKMSFALDGGIYITGAATQWLRDGIKIINSASETEQMATAEYILCLLSQVSQHRTGIHMQEVPW